MGDQGPSRVRRAQPQRRVEGRRRVAAFPRVSPSCSTGLAIRGWSSGATRLGGLHAPGPLAGLLRRSSRLAGVHHAGSPAIRHRDLLLEATGVDTDLLVNDLLIRFCAAFLDQGFAHWELPGREAGILPLLLLAVPPALGTARSLDARAGRGAGPAPGPGDRALESILESLRSWAWPRRSGSGTSPRHCWHFGAGRAWSGRSRFAATAWSSPCPPGSLVEFLAIRLLLDRFALAYTARELARDQDSRPGVLATGAGADRPALAAQRRAAGIPGFSARPDLRLSPEFSTA